MVQPCMLNTKEYKVIYIPSWNIQYVQHIKGKGCAFSSAPHDRLFTFVKFVVEMFKSKCTSAITNQLFRVDVFQNQDNELIVNEFESIDADFTAAGFSGSVECTARVANFLEEFWFEQLLSFERISNISTTTNNSNACLLFK